MNADNSWLSLLDSCQWMYVVSTALSVASEVAEKMTTKRRSVIIKGQLIHIVCQVLVVENRFQTGFRFYWPS